MDDTRGTRGTRVRRKQLNAILPSPPLSLASRCRRSPASPSLRLSRSVIVSPGSSLSFSPHDSHRASSSDSFPLSLSLRVPPAPQPGPSLPLRPQAAKLNKHSYLHSISGALTSLDNPATESSPSSTTYEPRSSFRYTHTSRPIEFDPPPRPSGDLREPRGRFPESGPAGIRGPALGIASGTWQRSAVLRATRADPVFAGRRFPTLFFHRADTA